MMYQERQPLNLVKENTYENLKHNDTKLQNCLLFFALLLSQKNVGNLPIAGKFKIFSKLTSTVRIKLIFC